MSFPPVPVFIHVPPPPPPVLTQQQRQNVTAEYRRRCNEFACLTAGVPLRTLPECWPKAETLTAQDFSFQNSTSHKCDAKNLAVKGVKGKGKSNEYDAKNLAVKDVKGKGKSDVSSAKNLDVDDSNGERDSDGPEKKTASSPGFLHRFLPGKNTPATTQEQKDFLENNGQALVPAIQEANPATSTLSANVLRIRDGWVFDAINPSRLIKPWYRIGFYEEYTRVPTFVIQIGEDIEDPPLACANLEPKVDAMLCKITLDAFLSSPPSRIRKNRKHMKRNEVIKLHRLECTQKTTSWYFDFANPDPSKNSALERFTWYPSKSKSPGRSGWLLQDRTKEVMAKYEGESDDQLFTFISQKNWGEKFRAMALISHFPVKGCAAAGKYSGFKLLAESHDHSSIASPPASVIPGHV